MKLRVRRGVVAALGPAVLLAALSALFAQEYLEDLFDLFEEATVSEKAVVSVPAAPTGVACTYGDRYATVSWNAVIGAKKYNLKRGTSPSGPFALLKKGIKARKFTDRTVVNGLSYWYVVSAVNGRGESADSASVAAFPTGPAGVPTELSAIPGDAQVKLTWAPAMWVTGGYSVKRSLSSAGPFSVIVSNLTRNTYTDSGLTNLTTYYYVVTAWGSTGESGPSAVAWAMPAASVPAAPTGLTAVRSQGAATLSWSAVAGATSYSVKRGPAQSGPYTVIANFVGTTGYVNSGLSPDAGYWYVVSAKNALGEGPDSAPASVGPEPSSSPVPTGLVAVGLHGRVALSWQPFPGALGYSVYTSSTPGGPYVGAGAAPTESYVDQPAEIGVTKYYVVTATTPTGTTKFSAEVSAIPTGPPIFGALLVTAGATLSAGDAAIKARLEVLGYGVTVQPQAVASSVDASGKALVVLSSSASSSALAATFQTVAVPVLTLGNGLSSTGFLGMTGTTAGLDYGTVTLQTSVSMVAANASHPMAAGRTGPLPVAAIVTFSWGRPNGNAVSIAAVADPMVNPPAVIFGYEANAVMPGLTAPARRVGFLLGDTSAAGLTADGVALFDAAVRWAAGVPSAPLLLNVMVEGGLPLIMWDEVPGALSYSILRATGSGSFLPLISGVSATSYIDASAQSSETYSYIVAALNDGGFSPFTAPVVLPAYTFAQFTVVGRPYLKTWRVPNGPIVQTEAEEWNKGEYEIKALGSDPVTIVPGSAVWSTPMAWWNDLEFTPQAGAEKVTIQVKSDKVGPGTIPVTVKVDVKNEATGLIRYNMMYTFPLEINRRAVLNLMFRWPVVDGDPSKQSQRPGAFFPASGDYLTSKEIDARREFAKKIMKYLTIFENEDRTLTKPPAPLLDQGNIDFYWDVDTSYKADPKNVIPASSFNGTDFIAKDGDGLDSDGFLSLQTDKNYLNWINVYFVPGITPGVATMGATIGNGGKDRRTILISDLADYGIDEPAMTIAHEIGHLLMLEHMPILGPGNVFKALMNNPKFLGGTDAYNLMYSMGAKDRGYLTEFQSRLMFKSALESKALRMKD